MEARAEAALRRATAVLRRWLAPLGRRMGPVGRTWRRLPFEMRIGGAALLLVVGGFFAAVVPLLTTGGRNARAEVSGKFPSSITLGEEYPLAVAVDNTSVAVISPICLVATSDPPGRVQPVSAAFQGLETVDFHNGRACGGSLSGEEVINVVVRFRPATTGGATLTLTAGQGATAIGPTLHGRVTVTAP